MIFGWRLWQRILHGSSRAAELAALSRRLGKKTRQGSPAEAELLPRLRQLRQEIADALEDFEACARCARNRPPPHGQWDGGFCCGGFTEDLFDNHELALLRQLGTRPADLRAPRAHSMVQAGCVFRGPQSCSLPPRHRPTICLTYLCPDLDRDLHRRGELEAMERICGELTRTYLRFIKRREERLDDALLAGTISSK